MRENSVDVAAETTQVNLPKLRESSDEIGKKRKRWIVNGEGGDEVVGDGEELLADQRERGESVAVIDEIEDQLPAFLRQIHELWGLNWPIGEDEVGKFGKAEQKRERIYDRWICVERRLEGVFFGCCSKYGAITTVDLFFWILRLNF